MSSTELILTLGVFVTKNEISLKSPQGVYYIEVNKYKELFCKYSHLGIFIEIFLMIKKL